MDKQQEISCIRQKYELLSPYLNERSRRMWASVEASLIGRHGVTIVSKATGLSRTTIHDGLKELGNKNPPEDPDDSKQRQRKKGGGRHSFEKNHPNIKKDLEALLETYTMGSPETSLKWTCKSTYKLAQELNSLGYEKISQSTVHQVLVEMEYSVQSNRKSKEGSNHPDRDAQFQHISQEVSAFQKEGNPVISVDTKKKENIGEFHNKGSEWNPKGTPTLVNDHDFPDDDLGKVVPYGVYDVLNNKGWVSVGISYDTAEFAVQSIKSWWQNMGKMAYPHATKLLITADCGGSNGYKVRLWKFELQKLANEVNLDIHVCHLPPGTSKWNKVEHRMFCHISQNWRGRPLTSREVVVNLIGHTQTKTGLKIQAQLDERMYTKGITISEDAFKGILIEKDDFHGEWNYKIKRNRLLDQVI